MSYIPMDLLNKLVDSLPDIPFLNKTPAPAERFFSLNINLSQITATVWWLEDHKIKTLEPVTLSYKSESEIVSRSHLALDQALADLPFEPKKIIFGVPSSWSQDDSLKPDKLKILKSMASQFSLTPLAFVTSSHALAHLLHQREGVVQTAVLLGLGEHLEVSVIKSGKIIDSREMKRTGHLFEDVESTLMQFQSVEVLPSKILVYQTQDGEDPGKLKDELVSYPWMNKLSFLHFPRVETLERGIDNKAVVFAAAFEVDGSVNLHKSFEVVASESLTKGVLNKSGFITGDVQEIQSSKFKVQNSEELVDISGSEREDLEHSSGALAPRVIQEEEIQISNWLTELKNKLRLDALSSKLPANFRASNRLLMIPGGILALLILMLLLVKAEVTVFVEPQVLERDATVTADPAAKSVDENAKVIPGEVIETSVSGSDKEVATGQKTDR